MFFADLDLLYWQAHENGLAYAAEERALYPDFEWDLGFRLAAGARLPKTGWEITLQFTHLHTKAFGDAEGDLSALFANPSLWAEEAHARWRLHFGEGDLTLGKTFFPTRDLSFKPYWGVRIAGIRQKWRVHYWGGDVAPLGEDLLSAKVKFLGGGLLTGINASWALGRGWALSCCGSLSIAYGNYYVHQSEKGSVLEKKRMSFREIFDDTAPMLDLAVGVQRTFHSWEVHFTIEEHLFWGQNRFLRFIGKAPLGAYVTNLGDLSLRGVALGASYRF